MKDTFDIKVCDRCGKKTAEEVISYDPSIGAKRKGWYCTSCFHWDMAIGRETKVDSEG